MVSSTFFVRPDRPPTHREVVVFTFCYPLTEQCPTVSPSRSAKLQRVIPERLHRPETSSAPPRENHTTADKRRRSAFSATILAAFSIALGFDAFQYHVGELAE